LNPCNIKHDSDDNNSDEDDEYCISPYIICSGSSSNTSVDGAVAMAASLSTSMLSNIPTTSNDNTKEDRQPSVDIEAGPSDELKDKAKTRRNRCYMCRKKVGLTGKDNVN
jgi:hypothetical protein